MIPQDAIVEILSYLEIKDLKACRNACKLFDRILTSRKRLTHKPKPLRFCNYVNSYKIVPLILQDREFFKTLKGKLWEGDDFTQGMIQGYTLAQFMFGPIEDFGPQEIQELKKNILEGAKPCGRYIV
jgi:hypothetical protein